MAHVDVEPNEADDANGIKTFFHCRQCIQELPPNTSPREWNRTETGLLPDGRIRVWCLRHHRLVADWPPKARA